MEPTKTIADRVVITADGLEGVTGVPVVGPANRTYYNAATGRVETKPIKVADYIDFPLYGDKDIDFYAAKSSSTSSGVSAKKSGRVRPINIKRAESKAKKL